MSDADIKIVEITSEVDGNFEKCLDNVNVKNGAVDDVEIFATSDNNHDHAVSADVSDDIAKDINFNSTCKLNVDSSNGNKSNTVASSTTVLAKGKKKLKRKAVNNTNASRKKFKKKKYEDDESNDDIQLYNETDYYFENGLRKIYPYTFQFVSYCKGRWIGRKLIDVFSSEFRAYPEEEYKTKIEQGLLTINNQVVSCDYELKNGDRIENEVHRHETPVIEEKSLKIIHMCDDVLVVDKPCSWPVHPCGRYRYNSVVFVLAKEYNIKNLRTIHRLDRLTSGILMFGRTASRTQLLMQQIRDREVMKEYLCRVDGNFPDESIMCTQPIKVISHKLGMCKVEEDGKDCETGFTKISYNGKTSLVLCKPKTGRMHQIRVHLQYLGHPISNDPLYNNEVFGKDKGKLGNYYKTNEELIQSYIDTYNAENWLGMKGEGDKTNQEEFGENNLPINVSTDNDSNINKENAKVKGEFDFSRVIHDPKCYECKVKFKDPLKKDLVMYLHALRYRGPGWMYETSFPYWAKDDFIET